MAQFNIDVDSGIIRISQLIYGICPGMSQATLLSSTEYMYTRETAYLVRSKQARDAAFFVLMIRIPNLQKIQNRMQSRA